VDSDKENMSIDGDDGDDGDEDISENVHLNEASNFSDRVAQHIAMYVTTILISQHLECCTVYYSVVHSEEAALIDIARMWHYSLCGCWATIFAALHGMQTRSTMKILSVHLSVCQTCAL